MIYLDTSLALAHLLAEDRAPAASIWSQTLVSSRLLEYELWTRINARGLDRTYAEALRELVNSVALLELAPAVLVRALEPFPVPVRTLDAIHLASADFLRTQHQAVEIATYDERLLSAARKMGFPISHYATDP